MDNTDRKIINLLGQNARKSLQSIAKDCDISSTAVHQRIKKLEDAKVIIGSTIILDPVKVGLRTMAFVGVYLDSADLHGKAVKAFEKVPEVVECSFTTGSHSLFLKLYCRDNLHLTEVLSDKIQGFPNVSRTETFIVLKHPLDRPIVLDIEEN